MSPVKVRVSRSPLRLLTFAVLAVPAILLSIDMLVAHRWISAPETSDVVVGQTTDESGEQVDVTNQVLTDTGRAERRRDVLFGGALFIGGVVAMGWALKELARPSHFLVADDDGLMVRVDGIRGRPRRIAWSDIREVRSAVIEDDGIDTQVLSLRFVDPTQVPVHPAGGFAEPPWLHLYADEWDVPAYQVAALVDLQAPTPAQEGETAE